MTSARPSDIDHSGLGGPALTRCNSSLFEGDGRFEIVVRLLETMRDDQEALKSLPVPLRGALTSGGIASRGTCSHNSAGPVGTDCCAPPC